MSETISHAQEQDVPRLLEIRYDAFMKYAPLHYSDREVKALIQDANLPEIRSMIESKSLFVAQARSLIVGLCGWYNESIRHMYVDPKWSGQGIGRRLLEFAEKDYIKSTRKPLINAGVIKYATGFYESNGYKIQERAFDWDGSEYYLMQKTF